MASSELSKRDAINLLRESRKAKEREELTFKPTLVSRSPSAGIKRNVRSNSNNVGEITTKSIVKPRVQSPVAPANSGDITLKKKMNSPLECPIRPTTASTLRQVAVKKAVDSQPVDNAKALKRMSVEHINITVEKLHADAAKIMEKIENARKEVMEDRLSECTFKPKLRKPNPTEDAKKSIDESTVASKQLSLIERNRIFEMEKFKKIQELRNLKLADEVKDCSFTPSIAKRSVSAGGTRRSGGGITDASLQSVREGFISPNIDRSPKVDLSMSDVTSMCSSNIFHSRSSNNSRSSTPNIRRSYAASSTGTFKRPDPAAEAKCSFQPELVAKYVGGKRSTDHGSIYDRLYEKGAHQLKEHEALAKLAKDAEFEQLCPFSPTLTSRLAETSNTANDIVFDRLYHQDRKDLADKREELELRECTFQPQISHLGSSVRTEGSVHDRLNGMAEQHWREQQKREEFKFYNELRGATFTPEIPKRSAKLATYKLDNMVVSTDDFNDFGVENNLPTTNVLTTPVNNVYDVYERLTHRLHSPNSSTLGLCKCCMSRVCKHASGKAPERVGISDLVVTKSAKKKEIVAAPVEMNTVVNNTALSFVSNVEIELPKDEVLVLEQELVETPTSPVEAVELMLASLEDILPFEMPTADACNKLTNEPEPLLRSEDCDSGGHLEDVASDAVNDQDNEVNIESVQLQDQILDIENVAEKSICDSDGIDIVTVPTGELENNLTDVASIETAEQNSCVPIVHDELLTSDIPDYLIEMMETMTTSIEMPSVADATEQSNIDSTLISDNAKIEIIEMLFEKEIPEVPTSIVEVHVEPSTDEIIARDASTVILETPVVIQPDTEILSLDIAENSKSTILHKAEIPISADVDAKKPTDVNAQEVALENPPKELGKKPSMLSSMGKSFRRTLTGMGGSN